MSDKIKDKMTLKEAISKAEEIKTDLKPYCELIEVAGSIRRKKPQISDVEIVVIPKKEERVVNRDLFGEIKEEVDLLDDYIQHNSNYTKRLNKIGSEAYGDKNKLLYYKETPLDIFTANTKDLVMVRFIRTGSYRNNIIVATQARKLGFKIEQYEGGYKELKGDNVWKMKDEKQVYEFIGMEYVKPENR